MGGTFSLDSAQFAAQAPVFHSAGDELAVALKRLEASITTEGRCWGDDEPGREFQKTYQPDATTTVQNVGNLVRILRQTGSSVKNTADEVGNHDLEFGRSVGNSGATGGIVPADPPGTPSRIGTPTEATPSTNDGYSSPAATVPDNVTQPNSESLPTTTDSTNSPNLPGSEYPDLSGAQQDSNATDTAQQPGHETAPATSADSGAPPSDPSTAAAQISNSPVADSDYADPMNASGAADGATGMRNSTSAPAMSRPPSPGTGPTPPRNPWSGGPPRRPDKKRKKPRKRPARVIAPADTDRPPPVDPVVPEIPTTSEAPDSLRRVATPWSKPGVSAPAGSPWKDTAHGNA